MNSCFLFICDIRVIYVESGNFVLCIEKKVDIMCLASGRGAWVKIANQCGRVAWLRTILIFER